MAWDAGAITGALKLNVNEYAHGMLEAEGIAHAFPPIVVEFLENPLLAFVEVAKEAAHALAEVFIETLNSGRQVDLAAQKLGMATEEFSKLSWAGRSVGLSNEEVVTGLRMLQQHAADAVNGVNAASESFQRLGISSKFLRENLNDAPGLLRLVMEHMDRLPTAAERTAAAVHLLGRSGADLVPLLAMGSAAIDRIGEEARAVGALETSESAAVNAAWQATVVRLEMLWEGLKKAFAEAIAEPLMEQFRGVLSWAEQHMPEIRQHVEKIAEAVVAAAQVIGPVIMWALEHLNSIVAVLGAGGLILVATKAAEAVALLGQQFLLLATRVEAATVAERGFMAASSGLKYGGVGAAAGSFTGGGWGGTIGGLLGGILGGLIGAYFGGPVGGYVGAAALGAAGGKAGQAVENYFTVHVNGSFDPRETAGQIAAKIKPAMDELQKKSSDLLSGAARVAVTRAVGGRNRQHYYSGL